MGGRLVCFDMDRVLVDYLSTWQWVYDKLGINNDESFALYNQGKLDEWSWIIMDLALIKEGCSTKMGEELRDSHLREWLLDCPMMKGWKDCIQTLLDEEFTVAIISGGMQHTAKQIAAAFPSGKPWQKSWGCIDRNTALEYMDGQSSRLLVFSNGWLVNSDGSIPEVGRFNVQMHGKGTVVKMLQRRLGIPPEMTVSVGDSSGDISMFKQSGFSINFNPWDERPKAHADLVIEEKDLALVKDAILEQLN